MSPVRSRPPPDHWPPPFAPLRRIAGEREGPAPKAWEGEVAFRSLKRSAAAHLTPALSPRKRAEREIIASIPIAPSLRRHCRLVKRRQRRSRLAVHRLRPPAVLPLGEQVGQQRHDLFGEELRVVLRQILA